MNPQVKSALFEFCTLTFPLVCVFQLYNPPTLQNNLNIQILEKIISKGFKVKAVQIWRQQQYFSFVNSSGQILDIMWLKEFWRIYIYMKVYRHMSVYICMSTSSLTLPLLTLVEQSTIPHIWNWSVQCDWLFLWTKLHLCSYHRKGFKIQN